MPKKSVQLASGKRKTAIARASIKPGKGRIRVNVVPIELVTPETSRMKMMEPLLLIGDLRNEVDIDINVRGGGFMGQAEAVRMAIARSLVKWFKRSTVERKFTAYDRTMLAGDPRRKESKKFGGPGARRRRQKSYR